MSEVGRRNRWRQRAGPSLGKYYSASANSDAFTKPNNFAVANSDSRRERSIDIFTGAEQSAGCVPFRDVRVSDLKRNAGQVNTAATRTKRVLLIQLEAAFMGLKGNEVSHKTLVVLAAHRL